jgi:glycosyltransferase involved in cell wall biosynthesis
MKVAVVLPELDPHQGGGFTFQSTLFAALREAEASSPHSFTFYSTGARREGAMRPLPAGRRADLARALHNFTRHLEDEVLGIPRHLSRATAFERSLARDGSELVWFTTPYAADCDLPYIATVWDLEHLRQPWFPEVSARGEFELRQRHYGRYLPKASAVIAANAVGTDQVMRWFGVPRERIIELAHPTPVLPAPESAGAGARRRPYLFYPAQLWPHKDHVTLFHALRELVDRGRDYELVLTGSDKGIDDHLRAAAAELGVADRVDFRGFVSLEELAALYHDAHALTFPSRFGPENLPPLEALTLGCPVVVADVPGIREQLGDGALYAPPGDATAIAGAVMELEDPARREQIVRAGSERARDASAERYVATVLRWIDDFEPTVRLWRAPGGR